MEDLHQEEVVLGVLSGLHLLGQNQEDVQDKLPLEQTDQLLMKDGGAVGVLGAALHDGLGAQQVAEQVEDQLDGKMVGVGAGAASAAKGVGQEGNKYREEAISSVVAALSASIVMAGLTNVRWMMQKESLVLHEGLGLTEGVVTKSDLFLDDAVFWRVMRVRDADGSETIISTISRMQINPRTFPSTVNHSHDISHIHSYT